MILKTCVLTEDYHHQIYYIQYYGVWFGQFIRLKIPYWISKSSITPETIKAIDDFYENFNIETEEMENINDEK